MTAADSRNDRGRHGDRHFIYRRRTGMGKKSITTLTNVEALVGALASVRYKGTKKSSKAELYDILYSFRWEDATFNNYGFAPAETQEPERFQLQLYSELAKLFERSGDRHAAEHMLEISCGRGGGLLHLTDLLAVKVSCSRLGFLDQCHEVLYSSLRRSREHHVCVRARPASAVSRQILRCRGQRRGIARLSR